VNTATAPLEDQLRATLRRHAGQTAPRADATDVRRRVQRRRRRRQVVPAVGAVAVIAAGIVVTSVKHDNSRTSTAAEVPGGPSFTPRADGPAYVELPGWQLERYAEIRYPADADTPAVTEPEYQWTRGGQRMQLHVYPGGNAMYEVRVGSDARSDAKVYGKDASLLDYGTGRYRVDVLIGEATSSSLRSRRRGRRRLHRRRTSPLNPSTSTSRSTSPSTSRRRAAIHPTRWSKPRRVLPRGRRQVGSERLDVGDHVETASIAQPRDVAAMQVVAVVVVVGEHHE
jgi:hypothetical protein